MFTGWALCALVERPYVLVCHVHDFASVIINDSHAIEAVLFMPIASNHICLFADVLKSVCLFKLASVLVIEHYGKQVAISMGQLWPFRWVWYAEDY